MGSEATENKAGLRLLALGGVVGAITASSCCVLPLLFATAGVSGAWIGSLTRLAPYQPIFLAAAVACIASGLWLAYGRPQRACEEPDCGQPTSRRAVKAALWVATAIVAVAITSGWWARLLA